MSTFAEHQPRVDARVGWPYYGWLIVPLAAAAMVGTLPGRTHGLGLITDSLLRELRLSPIEYGRINLWATLIGAAFCLPCGWMVDRLGARIVLTAVAALLGLATVATSRVETTWGLFLGVTLTRGLGQSMLSVVSLAVVGKWFGRRLPMAMGVYSCLVGVGFAAAFLAVGAAVKSSDWRTAWAGVGWAIICGLAPASALLLRDRPRDDRGEFASTIAPAGPSAATSATFGQALATPCFWVFALGSAWFLFLNSAIALFNQPLLAERGFPAETYHQMLALGALVGIVANLVGGWLAQRLPLARLLSAALILITLALLLLPAVSQLWHVCLYTVVMGVAGGLVTVLFFTVWGQAFGTARLGRIQGAAQLMTVLASAIGPEMLAQGQSQGGSYFVWFHLFAGLTAALAVVAWLTRVPRAREGAWEKAA
jgi:MFS family permease